MTDSARGPRYSAIAAAIFAALILAVIATSGAVAGISPNQAVATQENDPCADHGKEWVVEDIDPDKTGNVYRGADTDGMAINVTVRNCHRDTFSRSLGYEVDGELQSTRQFTLRYRESATATVWVIEPEQKDWFDFTIANTTTNITDIHPDAETVSRPLKSYDEDAPISLWSRDTDYPRHLIPDDYADRLKVVRNVDGAYRTPIDAIRSWNDNNLPHSIDRVERTRAEDQISLRARDNSGGEYRETLDDQKTSVYIPGESNLQQSGQIKDAHITIHSITPSTTAHIGPRTTETLFSDTSQVNALLDWRLDGIEDTKQISSVTPTVQENNTTVKVRVEYDIALNNVCRSQAGTFNVTHGGHVVMHDTSRSADTEAGYVQLDPASNVNDPNNPPRDWSHPTHPRFVEGEHTTVNASANIRTQIARKHITVSQEYNLSEIETGVKREIRSAENESNMTNVTVPAAGDIDVKWARWYESACSLGQSEHEMDTVWDKKNSTVVLWNGSEPQHVPKEKWWIHWPGVNAGGAEEGEATGYIEVLNDSVQVKGKTDKKYKLPETESVVYEFPSKERNKVGIVAQRDGDGVWGGVATRDVKSTVSRWNYYTTRDTDWDRIEVGKNKALPRTVRQYSQAITNDTSLRPGVLNAFPAELSGEQRKKVVLSEDRYRSPSLQSEISVNKSLGQYRRPVMITETVSTLEADDLDWRTITPVPGETQRAEVKRPFTDESPIIDVVNETELDDGKRRLVIEVTNESGSPVNTGLRGSAHVEVVDTKLDTGPDGRAEVIIPESARNVYVKYKPAEWREVALAYLDEDADNNPQTMSMFSPNGTVYQQGGSESGGLGGMDLLPSHLALPIQALLLMMVLLTLVDRLSKTDVTPW